MRAVTDEALRDHQPNTATAALTNVDAQQHSHTIRARGQDGRDEQQKAVRRRNGAVLTAGLTVTSTFLPLTEKRSLTDSDVSAVDLGTDIEGNGDDQ